MIPLGDENPTRQKPYIVYFLIIANVIVFMIDRIGAQSPFGNLWTWAMVPYTVVTGVQIRPEIINGHLVAGIAPGMGLDPKWLTIFTSMFMHGGIAHILWNMLYLWIFGNNIEDALGHVKFFLFYLACGVLAALAHIASGPNSPVPTVGASGAIAGVLGAYLYLFPSNRVRTLILLGFYIDTIEIPAIILLGVWFLSQLTNVLGSAGTMNGGVAYWAHIGGFVAGIVLIMLLGGRKLTRTRRPRQSRYDDNRPYPWRPWE